MNPCPIAHPAVHAFKGFGKSRGNPDQGATPRDGVQGVKRKTPVIPASGTGSGAGDVPLKYSLLKAEQIITAGLVSIPDSGREDTE